MIIADMRRSFLEMSIRFPDCGVWSVLVVQPQNHAAQFGVPSKWSSACAHDCDRACRCHHMSDIDCGDIGCRRRVVPTRPRFARPPSPKTGKDMESETLSV